MAATDPAECPPKRQKNPAKEVKTFGLEKETMKAGCTPNNDVETTPSKATESLRDELTASVGLVGRVANRSEVTIGSGDGSDKTTCGFLDSTASPHKTTGNDGWGFDWSETEEEEEEEENTELKVQKQENDGRRKLAFVLVFC